MQIFFSVGEPSGDQHAAHLISELKRQQSDIEVRGFGGPHMEEVGCRLDFQLTTMAVMGFIRVIPMLFQFYKRVKQAEAIFKSDRPDAVVLVDFPGFNWWVARKAKAEGIPVYYYLPPQLWAWASYRIRRVRKFVDHVLCALPFEYDWYAERGVKATYVGHPFFDEVDEHQLDQQVMQTWQEKPGLKVAVLPGSRGHEIGRNWPLMLEVMRKLNETVPGVQFLVGAYKEKQQITCERLMAEGGYQLPITFLRGKASEVIELGDCCLMVSGSISLEVMARKTPAVAMYYVSRFTNLLGRLLIHCKYMCLPNLMVDKELMIEFPRSGNPDPIVNEIYDVLYGWLNNPEELQNKSAELAQLREEVFAIGASKKVAHILLSEMNSQEAVSKAAA